MVTLHGALVFLHVLVGAAALFVFWLPIVSRKGSRFHNKAGIIFVWCMWIICLSGIVTSVMVWIDPIGIRAPDQLISAERAERIIVSQRIMSEFLLMLSFLVLVSVKHGFEVLKYKADRQTLKRFGHIFWIAGLTILGALVTIKGIMQSQVLLMIFGPIAILAGVGCLRYIYKKSIKPREWIMEHFSNMLGAGIGVYTAFFAFGGRAYLQDLLPGMWQVLPWVLPAIIGITATRILTPIYRKRYRIENTAQTPSTMIDNAKGAS